MDAIFKFFRSIRLAVVLIFVIIFFSILSTLVPQGKDAASYVAGYGPVLGNLVLYSGLANYTSSLIFYLSVSLFIVNLSVCTIDRLVTRARNKAVRHFGPDLIHISLLILAVGALITTAVRREQDFWMTKGDAVNLPGGYTMVLTDFEYLQYPDGRPQAWISTVDVRKGDVKVKEGFKIEVNHPLELGLLKVYQMNYEDKALLQLGDQAGRQYSIQLGQGFRLGGSEMYFAGAKPSPDATPGYLYSFEEYKGDTFVSAKDYREGDKIGDYTIGRLSVSQRTGLRAANDPGFIPVLVSLVLMSIGLTMTSVHKSKGVA